MRHAEGPDAKAARLTKARSVAALRHWLRNRQSAIPVPSFSLTFPRATLPFSLMLAARAPKTPEHNQIRRLLPTSTAGRTRFKETTE